ncbi:MAG: DM13 domain-containing protein, partial [Chloroflexi bacterium]|nr:DM13 domain-containing protein [Chloroflexota bacterium]
LSPARLALAGVALAVALGLVHILAAPAVTLLALAVAADGSAHLTRERLVDVGPRRYPLLWGAGGVAVAVGLVVSAVATVYLAQPLFDEGTRLEETLAFSVAGLAQPTASPGGVSATTATPSAGSADAQGELLSQGELMGTDAFHTASGEVLLVRSPDGGVVLRFQDYEVRNGPDLRIYLTPDPGGDVHADGAVEISAIRATQGFVNYDVPADLDHGSFRAVVIYCKPFSVTFAVAELQ